MRRKSLDAFEASGDTPLGESVSWLLAKIMHLIESIPSS